ncbi:hypothetical protein RM549_12050 [Salegentibacter sp. F188]|uniref:Uncharacterized protein n=1 Tax=Autumnicola patrickiae TaxID=3075591 RepID=A0ABU3E5P5_9FLAO|nr:hypothetical protein [Salegentibacter sp. F188]MDT0690522.1 hypothetical protein [Salegentibacter sp. F188]
MLLLIWFFTCKHWWYHAILIPTGMYAFQLVVAFYEDAYMDTSIFMDINGLIYLAPFFIAILCVVYLVRVKIFDRIYGLDSLSELEETEISVFSNISDRDRREIKSFQQEIENDESEEDGVILEDYYRKL